MNSHKVFEIPVWAYVYGGVSGVGQIKACYDDFIVDERLSFEPDGMGEHAFLQIEKRGENTDYVARLLARFAGVRQRDVSFAGKKDRHAKTTQWFSVWLPSKDDPEWHDIETETIKIKQVTRHARKLKRGVLAGNDFKIVISQWQGNKETIDSQLQQIKTQGFPNYFGLQRFGNQGQNITKAVEFFQGKKVKREQRSIYLSAARSYLFNEILAKRVREGSWNQAITGDVCMFDCSNSFFTTEGIDGSIQQRIKTGDIHPAGLLFGKQSSEAKEEALAIEQIIITATPELTEGLIKKGLDTGRRAFRVFPTNLDWEFLQEDKVLLSFSLPAGSYATSLLRELVVL